MIFTDELPKLSEIPSEYIEPYLKRFLSIQIESVASGVDPAEVRNELKAIQHFCMNFCGIHARYAVNNEYDKMIHLSDDEMIEICKKVYFN